MLAVGETWNSLTIARAFRRYHYISSSLYMPLCRHTDNIAIKTKLESFEALCHRLRSLLDLNKSWVSP